MLPQRLIYFWVLGNVIISFSTKRGSFLKFSTNGKLKCELC
ncbi:hypothetical protein SLEP1_g34401 [Rubroshorea leprosula]|uniref:Uncharacterized protein n=1 Tax=Rubroshorea leprosula TaxID=152421 RepID=A0AAV5KJQ0_9ROSI|nr:hypothetical protein SLEP1_g34401 [Rubroshorea leprosula]